MKVAQGGRVEVGYGEAQKINELYSAYNRIELNIADAQESRYLHRALRAATGALGAENLGKLSGRGPRTPARHLPLGEREGWEKLCIIFVRSRFLSRFLIALMNHLKCE